MEEMRIKSSKKLNSVRRFLGGRMAESLRDIPQLSSYFELDSDAIAAAKNELKAQNPNVTFTSVFVRIMADALREYPLPNSAIIDGNLVIYDSVNIGVAVGLESGVMMAVIREAQDKDIFAISDEMREKAEMIKNGALPLADMKGSTFSISSAAVPGFKSATFIINPPENAILGLGCTEQKLTLEKDGTVSARGITNITLTYNHMVLDGYHIGKLYQLMRERAAEPMKFMGLGKA